jgi:hypothetical protein
MYPFLMICTKCGADKSDGIMIARIGAAPDYICLGCQVARVPEETNLEQSEARIAEIMALRSNILSLLEKLGPGGVAEVPDAAEAFAFTPQKVLTALNAYLRNAEQDQENILAASAREKPQQPDKD